MSRNFKIETTRTITLGRDIGDRAVDLSKQDSAFDAFIYDYGLTQWLNDGGSNAKKPGADGVLDRVARVESGDDVTESTGGARVPEWMKIARQIVAKAAKSKGVAKDMAAANKAVAANLEGTFAALESEKDFATFEKECRDEAARRAEKGPSL